MDTVWLLQDDTDYYGPDFEAVFATREAAEAYVTEQDRRRPYKTFWALTEEPIYTLDVQPSEQ